MRYPHDKPRVLFVEQFYYPDGWGGAQLPIDLTVHLARLGFAVEVVCGSDQYAPVEDEPPPDPRLEGIRICRIPALLRGDIHRAKLLRQVWFYLALLPLLFFRSAAHLYIVQTNPPLALVLVAAAARCRRKPLMIIAMDMYPEVLIAHGTVHEHSLMGALMARMFRWAYRSAARVVALGPVMAERLVSKGVDCAKIAVIPNWATGDTESAPGAGALAEELELPKGGFVLLYSGNLGLAHEFETLLAGAARAYRSLPSLRLVFIGRGSRLAEVKRRVGELGMEPMVRFRNLLNAKRLPESFGVADLAIVTLRRGFEGLVVPSKLQGYWARGVPVLYIGPRSDIDLFVQRSGGGISCRNGDVEGVAKAILDLAAHRNRLDSLGVQARKFYQAEFSRSRGLARYESAVHSMLDGGGAAS